MKLRDTTEWGIRKVPKESMERLCRAPHGVGRRGDTTRCEGETYSHVMGAKDWFCASKDGLKKGIQVAIMRACESWMARAERSEPTWARVKYMFMAASGGLEEYVARAMSKYV